MSNRQYAIKILEEKGFITIKGAGNSMRPIILNGESIHLMKVDSALLRVGDAVFCKIKRNLFVHLISAIDVPNLRFQISNNSGFVNGWIGANNIFGLCVGAENRIFVSKEDLMKRKNDI